MPAITITTDLPQDLYEKLMRIAVDSRLLPEEAVNEMVLYWLCKEESQMRQDVRSAIEFNTIVRRERDWKATHSEK